MATSIRMERGWRGAIQRRDGGEAHDQDSLTGSARIPLPRLLILLAIVALALLYTATLQTHISGSFEGTTRAQVLKNEYVKDVAEIQVALNVWGTIHHTGYPLFAIMGNLFTIPLRALGVEPAAAASLYATAWGIVLLAGFGLLLWRLTGRPVLAALGAVLLGTARSIWIHNVLAEVYSMSMAITMLLLVVALWPDHDRWPVQRRVMWLALLGGIGVAHHRAVAFIAPGLIAAVWPDLWAQRARWRRLIPAAIGLALTGFLPYIYLPLRAWQDAAWVYGEPGTLRGLWTEFSGKEADRLVTLPDGVGGLIDNVQSVWRILSAEITLPGLLVGLACLGLAMTVAPRAPQRRAARLVALSAAVPALFAIFYHTAVLPEAILMPVVLALVFGVVMTADWMTGGGQRSAVSHQQNMIRRFLGYAPLIGIAVWASVLAAWHYEYVRELVTEPTGVNTIERLERLPRDGKPALMLPWGPRYAAASYSRLVTGENDDVLMVDHKGDFRALLNDGYQLYTEPETFYTYPPPWPTAYGPESDWWTERIGVLYLTSAAPGYVELRNSPWLTEADAPLGTPVIGAIMRRDAWLTCSADSIYLHVIWVADSRPERDPSIFVHLTGDEPAPNPVNADSRHPVYGLYPFARWSPGEIVRDDYTLPRLPGKTQVRFGLYEQDASGQFVNYGEMVLPVAECQPVTGQ